MVDPGAAGVTAGWAGGVPLCWTRRVRTSHNVGRDELSFPMQRNVTDGRRALSLQR